MIICVQMVPFALLIRWAYSTKAYRLTKNASRSISLKDEDSETGDSNELLSAHAMGRKNWQRQGMTYQGGRWGINAWAAYINPLELIGDGMAMYKLLRDVRIRKQTMVSAPESTEDASNGAQDQHQDTESLHRTPQEGRENGGYLPISAHPNRLSEMAAVSNNVPPTLQYGYMNSQPTTEYYQYGTQYNAGEMNNQHRRQAYQ